MIGHLRGWPAPAVFLAFALVGVVVGGGGPPPGRAPAARPYSAEAHALLSDLEGGADVAGWDVDYVQGPIDGAIEVRLARDPLSFSVWIVRRGAWDQVSPRRTEYYDLFYGAPLPVDVQLPAVAVEAALDALTSRVARREAAVAAPEGM